MELKTIDDVQRHLEELWGRQLATEFALKVVMENHPNPQALRTSWDAALSHFVDNLMEFPVFAESELAQEKATGQLANYSSFVGSGSNQN
jgi:hypothetical protein